MYVMGGNSIIETFDDVWRICLSDCRRYAQTQLALKKEDGWGGWGKFSLRDAVVEYPRWECVHRHSAQVRADSGRGLSGS